MSLRIASSSTCLFRRFVLVALVLVSVVSPGLAQNAPKKEPEPLTQTIRGTVTDAVTQQPLPGATVRTTETPNPMGAMTDENGRFEIKDVPVGRVNLLVSFLGYEPQALPNVLVVTGKETVLQLQLQETFLETEAVEIRGENDSTRGDASNTFATVSARSYNPEQAQRFAGSLSDPSRMALNFAGTSAAGDNRNDIVVRGNNPRGLLWRLEGLDIPSPNHFGSQGANGGPISMLNNNVLGKSDFFTGAFPAEYGDANAAAFDLSLRRGNPARFEGLFNLGFQGAELLLEGPFKKNSGNSFIVSYRYSSLAIFDAIGFSFGDLQGVPYFQDISFRTDFQLGKGNLTVFGVGGRSTIDILESELSEEDFAAVELPDFSDTRVLNYTGVAGLSYTRPTGANGYLKLTAGVSYESRNTAQDSLSLDGTRTPAKNYEEDYQQLVYQFAPSYTYKFNRRHNLKVGAFIKVQQTDLVDSNGVVLADSSVLWQVNNDFSATNSLLQAYAQWQWRATQRLTFNAGVHGLLYTLNNTWAVEPRIGARWQVAPKHALSLGAGLHHQVLPIQVYYQQNAEGELFNQDLDLQRSTHVVLGYDWRPWTNFRLKAEAYYQYLDQVGITPANNPSPYAVINAGLNFERIPVVPLVSNGTGRNVGIELTLEKFLANHWYALVTASVFDAKYTASDGNTYDSGFNNRYVINALGGVEYAVGKKKRVNLFGDLTLNTAGGLPYTPIDSAASAAINVAVPDESRQFAERLPRYFRLDVRVGIRQFRPKWSYEFAFQLKNATNRDNVFRRTYDPRTGQQGEQYQLGLLPVPEFRVYF